MYRNLLRSATALLFFIGFTTIALSQGISSSESPPAVQFSGGQLDLSSSAGALAALRKLYCSTDDNVAVFFTSSGEIRSRLAGEADRLLFKTLSMNAGQCISTEDSVRGKGFKWVSRAITLYLDPETGNIADRWSNPWTGKTVRVQHRANDPQNSKVHYEKNDRGEPVKFDLKRFNQSLHHSTVASHYMPNPLAGTFARAAGSMLNLTQISHFSAPLNQVTDPELSSVAAAVSRVRITPWLPWMQMEDRPGLLYHSAAGTKVAGYDELPEILQQAIATRYNSLYSTPPAGDEQRDDETSWSYYKKILELQSASPKP